MDQAENLFHQKRPVLQRTAAVRAARWRLKPEDAEDLEQLAAIMLWRQCLRLARPDAPAISCRRIVAAAAARLWHESPRSVLMTDLPAIFGPEAENLEPAARPPASIVVDGIRLTLADARLDDPTACDTWQNGIGRAEVARRLGVSLQRVDQVKHRLGGVCYRNRKRLEWRFPPNAGLPVVKHQEACPA